MALINCPECNKQISNKASNCPYCGFPLSLLNSEDDCTHVEPTTIENKTNDNGIVDNAPENNKTDTNTEIEVENQLNENKGIKGVFKKRIFLFNKKIPVIVLPITALVIIVIIITIILIPKGSNTTNKNTSNKTTSSQSSTTKPTVNTTSANSTTTSGTTRSGTTKGTTTKKVQYLSDRSVQFNEQDDDYVLLFGVKGENEEYLSSTGTASIVITDKSGNELFNKDIAFSDSDFSSWSNAINPTARYLCGLHIKASDISGSASSSGTLSFSVELDNGVGFESSNLNITNLRQKELDISLPKLPQSLTNYNFRNEIEEVIEVTGIEVETSVHYDGSASAKLHLTVGMLENYSTSTSHYSHVGYKLKDSDGVIVDSGNASVNPMAVGETSKDTIYINNLDANESYVLELENAKR